MTLPIQMVKARAFDVSELAQQLERPDVWNRQRQRTQPYGSPHGAISDIWVRFRSHDDVLRDPAKACDEHESVWYPVVDDIPALKPTILDLVRLVEGTRLGGVLITKIPPSGKIAPHEDHGWHAEYYEKFAIQILGNQRQAFCFEDAELRAEPGDVYTFVNQCTHWVNNDSDSDRITLICCIKR